jgi:hypothetical protein
MKNSACRLNHCARFRARISVDFALLLAAWRAGRPVCPHAKRQAAKEQSVDIAHAAIEDLTLDYVARNCAGHLE